MANKVTQKYLILSNIHSFKSPRTYLMVSRSGMFKRLDKNQEAVNWF